MWLNLGKFQDNGATGYILKPKYLRDGVFDPAAKAKVVKTLEVNVYDFM